jgi:excisionase family DNA binding protein
MAPSVSRPPLLLRIDEVAERLAVSRATTYRLIHRGLIPTVHIGSAVRVPSDALDRWLHDQVGAPASSDRR